MIRRTRTITLIACITIYLGLGALLFKATEHKNAKNQRIILNKQINDFKQHYKLGADEFEQLVKLLRMQREVEAQWDYIGSFYFVSVVLTLVGYGHQTPKTKSGKIVLMIYCLVGIPLTLNVLQMAGEALNATLVKWISLLKHKMRRCKRKKEQRTEIHVCLVSVIELVIAEVLLMAIVVCIGSVFFHRYEQWSLLDSVYYAITTLTTIGFGDFVPMRKRRSLWHLWNGDRKK